MARIYPGSARERVRWRNVLFFIFTLIAYRITGLSSCSSSSICIWALRCVCTLTCFCLKYCGFQSFLYTFSGFVHSNDVTHNFSWFFYSSASFSTQKNRRWAFRSTQRLSFKSNWRHESRFWNVRPHFLWLASSSLAVVVQQRWLFAHSILFLSPFSHRTYKWNERRTKN